MSNDTASESAERAAFDAWWAAATPFNCDQWHAWQARAALAAAPAPEQLLTMNDAYTLLGHAVHERSTGKTDMPEFFAELAARIAEQAADKAHGVRMLESFRAAVDSTPVQAAPATVVGAAPAAEPAHTLQAFDEAAAVELLRLSTDAEVATGALLVKRIRARMKDVSPAPPVGAGVPADLHAQTIDLLIAGGFVKASKVDEAMRILANCAADPQPPAQAEAHVGNSQFEVWFSTYNPAGKNDKQRARDAYAAGMADRATAAPADTEPLTWHPAAGPKLPDADEQCLLWIRYRDGAVDWEAGWLDGDGWRLCESGGLVDGEVLAWAQPGGPAC